MKRQTSSKKSNTLLSEISKKLDILTRLTALDLVKDIKEQKEKISILDEAGFEPKKIAEIIGTTGNNVRVTLHSIRKERATKESKESVKEENEKPAASEIKSEDQKPE